MGILTMNRITFPVAKTATPLDDRWTLRDILAIGNKRPSCLAFTAFPACFSEAWKQLVKLAPGDSVFLQQAINRRVAYVAPNRSAFMRQLMFSGDQPSPAQPSRSSFFIVRQCLFVTFVAFLGDIFCSVALC